MKKCFYFSTWLEQEDVMISLDLKKIVLPEEIKGGQMRMSVAGYIKNSLKHFDEQIDFHNSDYWENCESKYQEAYDELFDDLYDYIGKECDTQFKEKEDREKGILQSIPNDEILKKLCEKTGAKMYGDYLVVDDNSIDCFQEYSLLLQGKENAWEQIKETLVL